MSFRGWQFWKAKDCIVRSISFALIPRDCSANAGSSACERTVSWTAAVNLDWSPNSVIRHKEYPQPGKATRIRCRVGNSQEGVNDNARTSAAAQAHP